MTVSPPTAHSMSFSSAVSSQLLQSNWGVLALSTCKKASAEALCGAGAGSVSGTGKPEKRSQSLLASMRQAKDSATFDPPPLKSFRSVPPQVPVGVAPTGMEQQDSLAAGQICSLGRHPGQQSLALV